MAEQPTPGDWAWVCADCGQEFPEPGDASGVAKAMTHLRLTGQAGEKHVIRGLVDRATGELLVAGLNRNNAAKAGYLQPPKEGGGGKAGAKGEDADSAAVGHGQKAFTGSVSSTKAQWPEQPVAARVQGVHGLDLGFPAWALTYFDLLRPYLRDDEGLEYPWSKEGFLHFLLDLYRYACRHLVPLTMRERLRTLEAHDRERVLTAFLGTVEGMTDADFLRLYRHRLAQAAPELAQEEGA
jgi:hypothetical protein